jgi:hypothetical protein
MQIDPEREAVGRALAALLMAEEIKRIGGVHSETILTVLGGLAGFAAQMSIRKGLIEPQRLDAGEVLAEAVSKSGEKFYFSETLNWLVFENVGQPPYSIWSYVRDAVEQAGGQALPDLGDIVSHVARSVGTSRFGVPRLPPAHMPRLSPRAALDRYWAPVRAELIASRRSPADWPFDLAAAARWQILTSRDRIAPALAARIVMEAAIPMSKVDPATVPGA